MGLFIKINSNIILLAALFITACSSMKKRAFSQDEAVSIVENSKVGVLTEFAICINEGRYKKALHYLTAEDRKALLSPDNNISEKLKAQLKALELQTLITHKNIKINDGKISGLIEYLPELKFLNS